MSEQKQYASAEGKLEAELAEAKGNAYAKVIIGYLLERCKEDPSVAEDVMQEEKNWSGCFGYIKKQAFKKAVNGCACIADELVFEWAEDYYRMSPDGKEPTEGRAKTEAITSAAKNTAKQEELLPKSSKTAEETADEKIEQATVQIAEQETDEVTDRVTKKPKKPKKPKKETVPDGQMDIFSLFGL